MLILFKLQLTAKKKYKYLINSSTLPCHNHLPLFSAYHPNFLCIPNTATKLFWIIIVVGVKWWLKERNAKTKINFLLASAFEQQCGDKKRHARKIETKKKNEMRQFYFIVHIVMRKKMKALAACQPKNNLSSMPYCPLSSPFLCQFSSRKWEKMKKK